MFSCCGLPPYKFHIAPSSRLRLSRVYVRGTAVAAGSKAGDGFANWVTWLEKVFPGFRFEGPTVGWP